MAKSNQTGLEKVSVLVVDDHKNMRDLLKLILTGLGVGLVTAVADAAQAMAEMRAFPPDIIFVDWALEDGDGLDLVRRIRTHADSPNPFVPIVMLTGHTEYRHVIAARDAGVTEFLAKPLSGEKVAQRIESIIHRPRPFVKAGQFFGPDRRRQSKSFQGEDRRANKNSLLSDEEISFLVGGDDDDK